RLTVMDRLFIDELLRQGSAAEARAFLIARPEQATRSLIEGLREKVHQWVRVDVAEAARIAGLAWSLVDLVHDAVATALAMRARAQVFWAQDRYDEALDWF